MTLAPDRPRLRPVPRARAARPPSVDGLTSSQAQPRPAGRMVVPPMTGCPEDLPDPAHWCAALARAAVEIALGARPAVQLYRWLDPPVFDRLAERAALQTRLKGPGTSRRCTTVRGVRVCDIDGHHIEASAAVWDGHQVRAVAIRIEARRTRWLAVELRIA